MRNLQRIDPGFTLIELMIVVAIIAIIAAIAIPNMIRSRMAANESATIAACKEYGTAQDIYRRTDWDSDGVLEYSLTLGGPYSLYTETVSGDVAMIDKSFSESEGNPGSGQSKSGYVFRVLTGQGAAAPGGAFSYVVNGSMTLGYGLSAVPNSYDSTGRNSFQINSTGTVYQRDPGPSQSTHVTTYNPDSNWTVSE